MVLKSVAAEQPKNAFIFELLGDVYQDDGNYAAAESSYRRAILDDPTIVTNFIKLTDLLWYRFPERKSEIEEVLQLGIRASNHTNLHKRLARYYTDVGERAKAIEQWKMVLKEEPENEAVKEEIEKLEQR
jgi:tetratricopeptide (TPR) repeat protein